MKTCISVIAQDVSLYTHIKEREREYNQLHSELTCLSFVIINFDDVTQLHKAVGTTTKRMMTTATQDAIEVSISIADRSLTPSSRNVSVPLGLWRFGWLHFPVPECILCSYNYKHGRPQSLFPCQRRGCNQYIRINIRFTSISDPRVRLSSVPVLLSFRVYI